MSKDRQDQNYGDIEKVVVIIDKYDIIFGCHVFEHLENPILTLKNINNQLNPNGMLILATPLFVKDQILKGSDDDHIFVLNEWQIEKLLEYTRFKDIKIEKTGEGNRIDSIISTARK